MTSAFNVFKQKEIKAANKWKWTKKANWESYHLPFNIIYPLIVFAKYSILDVLHGLNTPKDDTMQYIQYAIGKDMCKLHYN